MTPPKVLLTENSLRAIVECNDYSSYYESAKFADGINYDGTNGVKLGVMGMLGSIDNPPRE
jgi:hypothetical protein